MYSYSMTDRIYLKGTFGYNRGVFRIDCHIVLRATRTLCHQILLIPIAQIFGYRHEDSICYNVRQTPYGIECVLG